MSYPVVLYDKYTVSLASKYIVASSAFPTTKLVYLGGSAIHYGVFTQRIASDGR